MLSFYYRLSPLDLTWYAPGGHRYKGTSIQIKNVEKDHEGKYSLYIIHDGIHIVKTTVVTVLGKERKTIY